jgi:hypothetical protein
LEILLRHKPEYLKKGRELGLLDTVEDVIHATNPKKNPDILEIAKKCQVLLRPPPPPPPPAPKPEPVPVMKPTVIKLPPTPKPHKPTPKTPIPKPKEPEMTMEEPEYDSLSSLSDEEDDWELPQAAKTWCMSGKIITL